MVQRDASAAVEDQRERVGEMGIQRWRSGEMRSIYGGLRERASDMVYLGDGVQEWNIAADLRVRSPQSSILGALLIVQN